MGVLAVSVRVCVCHVVGRFRISTTSESKLDFAVVAVWFVPARTRVVTTKKCTRRFVLLCSERRETGKLFRRGFLPEQQGPEGESEVGDRRALSSVCVCVCVCVCLCWSSGDSITRTGIRARFSPPTSKAVTPVPPVDALHPPHVRAPSLLPCVLWTATVVGVDTGRGCSRG